MSNQVNQDQTPLFYLVPLNDRTSEVVYNPFNRRFRSVLDDGTHALGIGHVRSKSTSSSTIATLGRGEEMDIYLPSHSMSTFQCSFEMNLESNMILFYDRSHNHSSRVAGDKSTPFEYGVPRRAVVLPGLNNVIGLGGERQNLLEFGLKWPRELIEVQPVYDQRQDNNDTTEMGEPWQMLTRIHTQANQRTFRYELMNRIGKGGFAEVYKAVDLREGNLVAVKVLQKVKGRYWEIVKREVETLEKLKHVCNLVPIPFLTHIIILT